MAMMMFSVLLHLEQKITCLWKLMLATLSSDEPETVKTRRVLCHPDAGCIPFLVQLSALSRRNF